MVKVNKTSKLDLIYQYNISEYQYGKSNRIGFISVNTKIIENT